MAMGSFNSPGTHMPTAEINMTPLVDVMLVLLIIFIITTPLMSHSVTVDLPHAASSPVMPKPMTLQVAIDADNTIFIETEAVDREQLEARFQRAVTENPQVDMHLKADRATRYETVAATMSAAHRAGLTRIGFVTQPGTNPMPPL